MFTHLIFAGLTVSLVLPQPVWAQVEGGQVDALVAAHAGDTQARMDSKAVFTTASKAVIRRSVAIAKSRASLRIRERCQTVAGRASVCFFPTKGEQFSSGGFDWFVWYEQNSHDLSMRTKMAKFPAGSASSQTSFALVTSRGEWSSHRVRSWFFSMAEKHDGQWPSGPDLHLSVAFFNPILDRVAFYDHEDQDRYGIATHLPYEDQTRQAILFYDTAYNMPDVQLYEWSVRDGALLSTTTEHIAKPAYDADQNAWARGRGLTGCRAWVTDQKGVASWQEDLPCE